MKLHLRDVPSTAAVHTRLAAEHPACLPAHHAPRAATPILPAVLLGEGELGGHNPERAAAWLAAAPPLFPRLRLQLAAHFSRLMPLLLGWCTAPQQAVRLAALRVLLQVIRLTWPRMPAHAAVVWAVLRRVHAEETQRRCGGGEGADSAAGSARVLRQA